MMSKNETYEEFVEKFKPKKTTDDCYTPPYIYDVVANWCAWKYGLKRENFVRPFFPGGDYENYPYKDNNIVVDNPPFSIISEICAFYKEHNIRFFLFAPTLTIMSIRSTNKIVSNFSVIYENGANVSTSFVTNMGNSVVSSAPTLYEQLNEAQKKHIQKGEKQLPVYRYPQNVITASMIGKLSRYGIDFAVRNDECCFIRALDEQKEHKKSIYGSGYLISDTKAAEVAGAAEAAEAAETIKWQLSKRELDIVSKLC